MKNYKGTFIHAFNLGDWYPCWNLSLSGRLFSPDFAAISDPGLIKAHKSIKKYTIEQLKIDGIPQGVPTPRSTWVVWAAAIIRKGGHVGIGQFDTKWLPKEERDKILDTGDIELEFESIRRQVSSHTVSRLSCLWVADDSNTGRAHVRSMLGINVHILKVSIPFAIEVTKVDTAWFDLYCQDRKEEYIKNYWQGIPLRDPVTWEYLVDGVIEATDENELQVIRDHGAHNQLSS